MTKTHGFELVREASVPELNTLARLYRHYGNGAELLSLQNDDENKVFGVSFRTPPQDSTGIAHILEHAVLGGSAKYPLKEPFVQLLKGSLKTFLNAMTYPDRTVYPVASQNLQDFYNLVDVYLDAVFFPLITPQHLAQEGWRYDLDGEDAPLVYKGVVFNEMKGAYSSPDNLLYRLSQQSIFPDNAYGYDSGGDPAAIPQLTYEQFKAFHKERYHPSNAFFYFYGDDPEEERLRIVDAALRPFSRGPADSGVTLQSRFAQPRRVVRGYDTADDGAGASGKRGMVQMRWLLPEAVDEELMMGLSLLSHALVGTQASPLRKRLIDSGLGEDLTGSGLSTSLRQMTFGVGMKGIDPDKADEVEALILATLDELSREGVESGMVEASYNTLEFSLRENNTGSYPRGLSLMMRALHGWLYLGDPIRPLGFEGPLAAVRRHLDEDPAYLRELIGVHLAENPHRATVILRPEPGLHQRMEEAERQKLEEVRRTLDAEAVQAIMEQSRELQRRQEAPDRPEDLARLPSLGLDDLDRQVKTIPIEEETLHDSRLFYHDLFTNGIVYLDLGFDLHGVPAELLPYAKLFGRALVEMGTETEDYTALSQRIGRTTGGIYPSTWLSPMRDNPEGAARLFVHAKAAVPRAEEMLAILNDILLTVKLDDPARFRQIVLRGKAGMESGLVPGGHSVVQSRMLAAYSKAGWAAEQIGGVSYLQFLRRLLDEIDNDWDAVLARLEQVRSILVNRAGMVANVTLDAANWREFRGALAGFVAGLPSASAPPAAWPPPLDGRDEGLTLPSQVNFVGKSADLFAAGYTPHGSISVITNVVRTGWLWDKVRAQGGAYGAFCRFGRHSGVFSFSSYRDPNLLRTLDVYDETAAFLRSADLSQDELVKSIIGAIGALDAYQLPDAKGYTSMVRRLLGESDEERQRYRDEVLGTTLAHIRGFADVLEAGTRAGRIVVLGGEDAVNRASTERGLDLEIVRVL